MRGACWPGAPYLPTHSGIGASLSAALVGTILRSTSGFCVAIATAVARLSAAGGRMAPNGLTAAATQLTSSIAAGWFSVPKGDQKLATGAKRTSAGFTPDQEPKAGVFAEAV